MSRVLRGTNPMERVVSPPNDTSPPVVITGASTGLGAASALELDRRGFRVFAGVRSAADAQRLQAQASPSLTPLWLDVTDPESIGNAADSVAAAVGDAGLAGLVNNAGIVIAGPLELLPLAQFRNQLEVNVVGLVAVTQAFLPLLRVARGRIVNMGSLNGSLAPPYLGAYAASKFALEALSDALRIELRNWRIRVSIIEPGPVNTPIWEKALATADRMAGEVSADALRPYDADLAAMRRATLQAAETAAPVKKVTRAVCHALTARRPKTRYFIPLHTYFLFNQFRLVPACIRDWFVRRAIGLS
jgi:NAD(P)-dependent dehydrogenase (short-subunit alcohol dehydrogenase family)